MLVVLAVAQQAHGLEEANAAKVASSYQNRVGAMRSWV